MKNKKEQTTKPELSHDPEGFDYTFGRQILTHVLKTANTFEAYEDGRDYLRRTVPPLITLFGSSAPTILRTSSQKHDIQSMVDFIEAIGYGEAKNYDRSVQTVLREFTTSPYQTVHTAAHRAIDGLSGKTQGGGDPIDDTRSATTKP